jgi:hypothetical protein
MATDGAMASRKNLNAKDLEALGAERLAELLVEVSTGNAGVKRRIRLELASLQSSDQVANTSPTVQPGNRGDGAAFDGKEPLRRMVSLSSSTVSRGRRACFAGGFSLRVPWQAQIQIEREDQLVP